MAGSHGTHPENLAPALRQDRALTAPIARRLATWLGLKPSKTCAFVLHHVQEAPLADTHLRNQPTTPSTKEDFTNVGMITGIRHRNGAKGTEGRLRGHKRRDR